jgi:integrase
LKKNTDATLLTRNNVSMEGIAINKGNHSDIYYNNAAASLDKDIEDVCAGLQPQYSKYLHNAMDRSVFIIINYINAMRTEVNLSDNYRKDIIKLLCIFSKFNKNKPFNVVTKTDILTFLNSFRRDEATDQMHSWIGTYNIYRIHLLRFFKWLHFPDIEPGKRPKPEVIQNIPSLRRKEKSIYKPTDLWTVEDDLLFLKYCPSKRNKCYHAMAHDTGCRPHELLKLRIKDISFRSAGNRQYAEVFVNGKTGSRHIPLIDSVPYIKDYLDHEHPHPGNPNAILLCGTGKSLGRILNIVSLSKIYNDYKTQVFPKLLLNPNLPPEDKQKIIELLKKPWNPYIRQALSTWNIIYRLIMLPTILSIIVVSYMYYTRTTLLAKQDPIKRLHSILFILFQKIVNMAFENRVTIPANRNFAPSSSVWSPFYLPIFVVLHFLPIHVCIIVSDVKIAVFITSRPV